MCLHDKLMPLLPAPVSRIAVVISEPVFTSRLVSPQGIHQNGGFTKVWFAMKTFLTPSILIIMVWYWRRITLMTRAPVLLEK